MSDADDERYRQYEQSTSRPSHALDRRTRSSRTPACATSASPPASVLALITLDNGRDHTRPNTLGPATLTRARRGARRAEGARRRRARSTRVGDHRQAVHPRRRRRPLATSRSVGSKDNARLIAQLGHKVLGKLSELGVPSFAFVNGLALGGGLEIALNSTYRTVDASAAAIALPEVFLGIIPGWGGAYLLPNLIGIENALEVVISNPLKQNRMLKPQQAFDLGIVGRDLPRRELPRGLAALGRRRARRHDRRSSARTSPARSSARPSGRSRSRWRAGCSRSRIGTVPSSPYVALDLLDKAKSGDEGRGIRRGRTRRSPTSSPATSSRHPCTRSTSCRSARSVRSARPTRRSRRRSPRSGIIGAGLMASQFALLFVRRLQVPVLITDLDQARVDKGVAYIHDEIGDARGQGPARRRHREPAARRSCTGTTDKAEYADCDFVIEAVFEEVGVKQQVFAEIEQIVAEDAILATNTSSLSVERDRREARPSRAPRRLPLLQPRRRHAAHRGRARRRRRRMPRCRPRSSSREGSARTPSSPRTPPGFVVNRLLAKVMGEAARAVYEGTPVAEVEKAFAPLGLPMGPFQLHRPRRLEGRRARAGHDGTPPSPTASTPTRTSTRWPSWPRSSRRTRAAASRASRRRRRRC